MKVLLDPSSLKSGFYGGALIGLSSAVLFWSVGQTLGVSSILRETLRGKATWQVSFLAGLSSAGAILANVSPSVFGSSPAVAVGAPAILGLITSGVLVGYGTAEGGGCTSGHGVVGLARLSPRSAAAVCTFMAAGALVAGASQQLVMRAATGFGVPLGGGGIVMGLFAATAPLLLSVTLGGLWSGSQKRTSDTPTTVPSTPSIPFPSSRPATTSEHIVALCSGTLFGIGLGISGMANPSKVRAFLDFTSPGGWDPTLAFVMGGAVCVSTLSFYIAHKMGRDMPPLCALKEERTPLAEKFAYGKAPPNLVFSTALFRGALIFGAGWGLAGYCPGPAILSASAGSSAAGIVFASIIAGALIHETISK